jgi:hypothetical protein
MSVFAPDRVGSGQPRRSTALHVGLPLVAAVFGAILGFAFPGNARDVRDHATVSPAGHVIAAGDLRLTLPDGWTRARAARGIPGFDKARAAFAQSWSGDVAMGLLPATSASLLPAALDAAARPRSPGPRIVQVGAIRAYHDIRVLDDRHVVEVYSRPTTQGVATIACSSTAYEPGQCEAGLLGLRLAHGSFLPLSAEAAFLVAIPAVVTRLNAERTRLRARLARASQTEGAAVTAARLARAYAAAGDALRPLVPPRSQASATVRLLHRLRIGHRRLAWAVRNGDRTAFARGASAIDRDEARLAATLEGWQRVLAQGR